jgi:bifunctional polynucleotide phosphatase/kinase
MLRRTKHETQKNPIWSLITDKKSSFFVGDAAGRPDDFASTDRKWAINVGLPFYTPEVGFASPPRLS